MSEELRVVPGTLLAAWPDLVDPNFMHAVVLMCQHTEAGAYGLVVNRPTPLTTAELLSEHPDLGSCAFPVYLGGPVDHKSMQFVHTVPQTIPGGLSLDGRLWLGGDLDHLGRYLADDPAAAESTVRVFLGYAGWGAGQLEQELAGGSWLPAPLSIDAIFGRADQETVWREVVRSIGEDGLGLESQPPDPSWN